MYSLFGSGGCVREGEVRRLKCYCDIGIGNEGIEFSQIFGISMIHTIFVRSTDLAFYE